MQIQYTYTSNQSKELAEYELRTSFVVFLSVKDNVATLEYCSLAFLMNPAKKQLQILRHKDLTFKIYS